MKLFDRTRQPEPEPVTTVEPTEATEVTSIKDIVNEAFADAAVEGELSPKELERKKFVEDRLRDVFGTALQEVELDTDSLENPDVAEIRENLAELDIGNPSEASKPSDL